MKQSKNIIVAFRVSEEEKEKIHASALEDNYANASDFIRKTVLDSCKKIDSKKQKI